MAIYSDDLFGKNTKTSLKPLLSGLLLSATISLSPIAHGYGEEHQSIYPQVHRAATALRQDLASLISEIDNSADLSALDQTSHHSHRWIINHAQDSGYDPVQFYTVLDFFYRAMAETLESHAEFFDDNDDLDNILMRIAIYLMNAWYTPSNPAGELPYVPAVSSLLDVKRGQINIVERYSTASEQELLQQKHELSLMMLAATLIANKPLLFTTRMHVDTGHPAQAAKRFLFGPVYDPVSHSMKIAQADYTHCPTYLTPPYISSGEYSLDSGKVDYAGIPQYDSFPDYMRQHNFTLPDCAQNVQGYMSDYLFGSDGEGNQVSGLAEQLIKQYQKEWYDRQSQRFTKEARRVTPGSPEQTQFFHDYSWLLKDKITEIIDTDKPSYRDALHHLDDFGRLLNMKTRPKRDALPLIQTLENIVEVLDNNVVTLEVAQKLERQLPFYSRITERFIEAYKLRTSNTTVDYDKWLNQWLDIEPGRIQSIFADQKAALENVELGHHKEIVTRIKRLTDTDSSKQALERFDQYTKAFHKHFHRSNDADAQVSLQLLNHVRAYLALTKIDGNEAVSQEEIEAIITAGTDGTATAIKIRDLMAKRFVNIIPQKQVSVARTDRVDEKASKKIVNGLHNIYQAVGIKPLEISPYVINSDEQSQAKRRLRRLSLLINLDKYPEQGTAYKQMQDAALLMTLSRDYLGWRGKFADTIEQLEHSEN